MSIHVSQFYACSEVKLSCELYYICELGKYSLINHNEAVSIDGVILDSVLKKSHLWQYFLLAVEEGWIVDAGVSEASDIDTNKIYNYLYTTEEVKFDQEDHNRRESDYNYSIRTPRKSQVSFKSQTDDCWTWAMYGEGGNHFLENNRSFNRNNSEQGWLGLIAMVAVERLFTGVPQTLKLEFIDEALLYPMALSYVMIIADEANCFNNWVELDSSGITDYKLLQLSYFAWYMKGREIGMCNRWYTGKEKLENMKKLDLKAGDLVMLYRRAKSNSKDSIKEIAGCNLAKIVEFDEVNITFDVINTAKPRSTGKIDFDDNTIIVKRMYTETKPYEKLNHNIENHALADVGVGYMLGMELLFMIPLDDCDDVKTMWVADDNGDNRSCLNLTQNNLTYWILKDYNYEFNEGRFLNRYFKNEETVYDRFMRGEQLEPWLYAENDN